MKNSYSQKQNNRKSIRLFTKEANIKRALRRHLKSLGFIKNKEGNLCPPDLTKECFRELHSAQRKEKLEANSKFINDAWPRLKQYFAKGDTVQLFAEKRDGYIFDSWS